MEKLSRRVHSYLASNFKFFHHPDFDSRRKKPKIVAEMPDMSGFITEREKVMRLRSDMTQPEMRPCYEEPLLSREQEFHLFRKMNYLKYQVHRIRKRYEGKNLGNGTVDRIEQLTARVIEIRNQLANSNFRLATWVLKNTKRFKFGVPEKCLSDAYLDVLKSVDYFNYTLGFKFSTYCIWVLQRNFYRGVHESKSNEEFVGIEEGMADQIASSESDTASELNQRENASYLNRVIEIVRERSSCSDIERQIAIVESYYGINGKERRNLEQISRTLGVTKERVRQLKEKFLNHMREAIRIRGTEDGM